MALDYRKPGVFTRLDEVPDDRFTGLAGSPAGLCAAVPSLFLQPWRATERGWASERFETNRLRSASALVHALWRIRPTPMSQFRDTEFRVVGTCRHFSVLSVALLRRAGVAARARCGFARYFEPGLALDHWIVEFREHDRWVRMDTEVLDGRLVETPADLPAGAFLSAAEAWHAYRRDEIDASSYGVGGTSDFGPSEIRGNLVRDLAALASIETLPWDGWGRMADAYGNRTGPEYDVLLDEVASAILADDSTRIQRLLADPDLAPPLAAWDAETASIPA